MKCFEPVPQIPGELVRPAGGSYTLRSGGGYIWGGGGAEGPSQLSISQAFYRLKGKFPDSHEIIPMSQAFYRPKCKLPVSLA